MLPQQALAGLVHQRRIDGFVVVADALAEDRRAVVVVVDDVTVATGGGAEAGMEMLSSTSLTQRTAMSGAGWS